MFDKLHGPRALWMAPLLCVPLAVGACGGQDGGSGADGETRPDGRVVAMILGAFAVAVALLPPLAEMGVRISLKRELLDRFNAVPTANAKSCEDAIDHVAENVSDDLVDPVRDAKITKTTVEGDSATVSVKDANEVKLSKIDGRWYISGGFLPTT